MTLDSLILSMELIILPGYFYMIFLEKIVKEMVFQLYKFLFTHNTLQLDCKSIKEIHDYVKAKYEYRNFALNSTFRAVRNILYKVV